MRLPNLYIAAKKYATYMKESNLGGKLKQIYEENEQAKNSQVESGKNISTNKKS